MRYLVTGGAGFIGSHTVEELLRSGHEVTVIDDLSTGKRENIDDLLAGLRGDGVDPEGRFRFVQGDIRDQQLVSDIFQQGIDIVIHLAAIPAVPRSVKDPKTSSDVNFVGTVNILEQARRAGVKRFVCASSSSVYGDTPSLPKTEDMVPTPQSPYAVSKYACELFGKMFVGLYPDLNISFLRYFNVFGPRQDPSSGYAAVVPAFVSALLQRKQPVIYGDGTQSRDFTYVKDAVKANLLAAQRSTGFSVFNVARNHRTSLLELLDMIYEIIGYKIEPVFAPARPGDVKHSQASLKNISQAIGYTPDYTVRQGLELAISWYREHKSV